MARKRWTPQEEINDTVIKTREKRKWQIALRRYVLEQNICFDYAAYFGIDIQGFRKWIEVQFTKDLNWDNFGKAWQFDHVVPVSYFDIHDQHDLKLCWNFVNIRVAALEEEEGKQAGIDILSAKKYFQHLYQSTAFTICLQLTTKLEQLEEQGLQVNTQIESFLSEHANELTQFATLNSDEFHQVNTGTPLSDVVLQKEMLRKFG